MKGTLGICGIKENVEYINMNVENKDKYDLIEKYLESNRGCTVEKTDSVFLYKKVTDNKPIIKKLPKI